MDTKVLFSVLLVAGILGGFSINEYLIDEENGNVFSENNAEEPIEQVEVGNEAPDFALTDTDGNEFNLSDYEGEKVLVLEFTNMNCGTCKNFENNEDFAHFKIYFTPKKSEADFAVYFTEFESFAGCLR